MTATAERSPAAPAASEAYSRYVLGVLFLVYVFNFIDRQILSILIDPIKEELGVSDTAMGFLTGFAFAIFYTVAGIPIARLADRGVRRSIIAVGLTVWSVATALCGLAGNFLQLAVARVGGRRSRRSWGPWDGAPRLLRIDHGFVTKGMRVDEFQVLPVRGSDHSAIVMGVLLD